MDEVWRIIFDQQYSVLTTSHLVGENHRDGEET